MKQSDRSLNALKHGASAKTLFLPTEDPAQFDALLDDAFEQYKPANAQDSDLVYDSVEARWFLRRRQHIRASSELELHLREPNCTSWSPEDLHQLGIFDRYCTTAERAFRRALVNVRFIHTEAVKEHHWREQLDLRKQSLEIAQAKEARLSSQSLKEEIKSHREATAPIQRDVIVQRAFISVNEDGATILDQFFPSNDQVRKLIETASQFPNPLQSIVRHYSFLNDIPQEYHFLVPNGFERNADARYQIRQEMDFTQFLELASRESTCQEEDEDQPDLSDENWLQQQRKRPQ